MFEKEKAVALIKKHKSRNPFEIIAGMNAFIVYASLCDIRDFTSISKETISFILTKIYPKVINYSFVPMN